MKVIGGRCATCGGIKKFDLLGVSLANSAIVRAEERDTDISEMVERCVRVVV